ncbi:nuclear control of ATPase protein 2 [Rhizoctonia solani]|uniref:Nuclear control of ATPase protein 2 n=1 Tax=Rhizoctonia solani TaxID=456999 RepID=A0A8H8NVS9_9AGAM|nr:nuclear control of ATPase protein 2 [Rhizoctonia solani]QRW20285.1 nuclear control of ATPase protein 2 [Rhizoctonia solani]
MSHYIFAINEQGQAWIKPQLGHHRADFLTMPPASDSQYAKNLTLAATELRDLPPANKLLGIVSGLYEDALEYSVALLVTLQVYQRSFHELRDLALESEDEAEWWAEVQRRGVAYFLLQTLPDRLIRLARQIYYNPSPLPFASLASDLGAITGILPAAPKPSPMFTALFPHLNKRTSATWYLQSFVQLAQSECSDRRVALEAMRDSYAKQFADLHSMGPHLIGTSINSLSTASTHICDKEPLRDTLNKIGGVLGSDAAALHTAAGPSDVFDMAKKLLGNTLPNLKKEHVKCFADLRRPSRFVLAWPKLVLGPPILLLLGRSLYKSRISLRETVSHGIQTVKSFWKSYVEATKAYVLSARELEKRFDREELLYTLEQLAQLPKQVKEGNLADIMRLYEADMKPLSDRPCSEHSSVDVDFTLNGIDKLLRSQELTFGFVGVAPALAIVYVFVNWVRDSLAGTRGRGRSEASQRARAFDSIRRVERLCSNLKNTSRTDRFTLLHRLLLPNMCHRPHPKPIWLP